MMSAAQRFLVAAHSLLALGYLLYAAALGVLVVRQAETGYMSEGARYSLVIVAVLLICTSLVAIGTNLWARWGLRRFALGADLTVLALSWTVLLVLMFFEPIVYVAFLGLTMFCPVLAMVVPPPGASRAARLSR